MIVGIGIDIEEVDRVQAAIDAHKDHFLERVYTAREVAYVRERPNRAQRFAARFAAKEAAMKALGTGWSNGVTWRDVEILNAAAGGPELLLHGRAREIAAALGSSRTWVSLSHHRRLVVAQVILESSD